MRKKAQVCEMRTGPPGECMCCHGHALHLIRAGDFRDQLFCEGCAEKWFRAETLKLRRIIRAMSVGRAA
jgi:hypothetical protein